MQNHTTTAEVITFSSAGQVNRLIRYTFGGLPNNKHPVVAGSPRIISRDEAELIMVAVDLNNWGFSPKALKFLVCPKFEARIHAANARLMVLKRGKAGPELFFCDEIEGDALEGAPLIIVDLRSVKARVDAAIEFAAVRRWGMERAFLKALPKTQDEIKAARDMFIARRKSGEPV